MRTISPMRTIRMGKAGNGTRARIVARPWCRIVLNALLTIAAQTTACTGASGAEPAVTTPPPLRGIVKALNQAAFATELLAPVARIGFREGESFKAGELLIEFDCARQRHELAALAAIEREMQVGVETSRVLIGRGAANRNDVEIAAARHDKARAETSAMGARLAPCRLLAPFDGAVSEISINAHELPTPNRSFLVIVGRNELEIEIIAPSALIRHLKAGDAFEFAIDETAQRHGARVQRLGGVVDPVSQTMKIFGRFEGTSGDVVPGMSGTARLEFAKER